MCIPYVHVTVCVSFVVERCMYVPIIISNVLPAYEYNTLYGTVHKSSTIRENHRLGYRE